MSKVYGFGIEEGLFLADADTRGTPRDELGAFHDAAARLDAVSHELLLSQVEICTSHHRGASSEETADQQAGVRPFRL